MSGRTKKTGQKHKGLNRMVEKIVPLLKKYGVRRAGIFGSFHGERAKRIAMLTCW